jgi:hypothetical protein
MKRFFTTLAAAASMILLLIALAFWIVSYFQQPIISLRVGHTHTHLDQSHGRFFLRVVHFSGDVDQLPLIYVELSARSSQYDFSRFRHQRLGFGYGRSAAFERTEVYMRAAAVSDYADRLRQISAVPTSPELAEAAANLRESLIKSSGSPVLDLGFPHWFLVAISLVLPVVRWRRMQCRKRHRRMGECVGCGYDLRASPDRCPECGLAITAPTVTPTVN